MQLPLPSWVTSRPQWGQRAAGPAPLPASAAIAEGFVHLPKERRFFFSPACLPGGAIWVSQHPPPAYILSCLAERCSRTGASRDPGYQVCVPAAANGDPWVLAGDPHSRREIVLTARFAPIPLLSAGHDRRLFIQPRPPQRGVEGAGRSHGVRRPRRSPGCGQSPGAARLPWESSWSRGCAGQRLCPMGGGESDSSAAFARLPLARRQV